MKFVNRRSIFYRWVHPAIEQAAGNCQIKNVNIAYHCEKKLEFNTIYCVHRDAKLQNIPE
jgi:hypothetical protein